jgi:RHS repeat-associated protein
MEERFTYDRLDRLTGVIEGIDTTGVYYVHPDHLGSWTTVTSTFLSVDNYVQDPSSTQNFNRYAYCMNNPLKYTDPDGEWAHLLIGALIGGVVNLATNWTHIDTFGEGLAYFGIGAAAGAIGAATGGAVSGAMKLGGFISGAVSGAAGGASSGMITGSGEHI